MATATDSSTARTSNTVVTVMGVYNQLAGSVYSTYTVRLNTTINTKRLNVFKDVNPSAIPRVRYFGIGLNGYKNTTDGNMSTARMPDATNLDLYEPIPLAMVPIEEDEAFDRNTRKYRLRTVETWNGQQYACYWLKCLEFIDSSPALKMINANDQAIPYEIDPSNLNPTPNNPDASSVINNTQNRIVASIKATCPIYGSEVLNVVNIRYGDPRKAFLSEIGIYTGEDRVALPVRDGVPFEYTDANYTQLAVHRCWRGTDMSDPSSYQNPAFLFENGKAVLM